MLRNVRRQVAHQSPKRNLLGVVAGGVLLSIIACQHSLAQAEDSPRPPAFSLNGFGTLGIARSNTDDVEFVRDQTQPRGVHREWSTNLDSIAGIQATGRASNSVSAVLQAVSHYRYDGTFRPEITWAFAKYDATPSWSFRLGRIGTEFLMQADSRLVGYSYLPIRPPVDFFGPVFINYSDGIDARLRSPLGDGVFVGRLGAGIAKEQIPQYDLRNSRIYEASLGYEATFWQIRYNYAQSRLANGAAFLAPVLAAMRAAGANSAADSLDLKRTETRYNSLGAVYDDGSWLIQAAASTVDSSGVGFQDIRAGYLLAGYHIGQFSPFLSYSRVRSEAKEFSTGLPNPMFASLNAAVDVLLASSHLDRHTVSAGVRWDIRRNTDVKIQLDQVQGSPSSILLTDRATPSWNGRITVFSVALDFVF